MGETNVPVPRECSFCEATIGPSDTIIEDGFSCCGQCGEPIRWIQDDVDRDGGPPDGDAVDADTVEADAVEAELSGALETYRSKNEDYGGAWRLASETIALWCRELDIESLTIEADSESLAEDVNSLMLYERRLEKMIRAFNGEMGDGVLDNEPVVDSHRDAIPYAAMHAVVSAGDSDE